MTLTALAPILWTENLTASIAFYYHVLSFRCVANTEAWACLEHDGVELMLSLPNRHEPYDGPRFSGSLYFRCHDVDTWWDRVKERATVVYPIENFDYGMREFAIRDNNGYILQFGKSLEEADVAGDEFDPLPTMQGVLDLAGGTVFEMSNSLVGMIGYAELAQEKLDPGHPVAKHVSEIRRIGDIAKRHLHLLGEEVRRVRKVCATLAERRRPRR